MHQILNNRKKVWLYFRRHYHESSDYLNTSPQKYLLLIFLPPKNSRIEDFKPPKILRLFLSLEIRSTPPGNDFLSFSSFLVSNRQKKPAAFFFCGMCGDFRQHFSLIGVQGGDDAQLASCGPVHSPLGFLGICKSWTV